MCCVATLVPLGMVVHTPWGLWHISVVYLASFIHYLVFVEVIYSFCHVLFTCECGNRCKVSGILVEEGSSLIKEAGHLRRRQVVPLQPSSASPLTHYKPNMSQLSCVRRSDVCQCVVLCEQSLRKAEWPPPSRLR